MKYPSMSCPMDFGPNPFVAKVGQLAGCNTNFRTAIWTGEYGQMTLMCIPVHGEVGMEIHEDTDQILRVEQGFGMVYMGEHQEHMDYSVRVSQGDTIFVPAGAWHNLVNAGRVPLRLSSIYAPPHHKRGTVQYMPE